MNKDPPNDVGGDLIISHGIRYLEEDEEDGKKDFQGESCQDEDTSVDGRHRNHDEGQEDDDGIKGPNENEAGNMRLEVGKVGGRDPEDQNGNQLRHPPDHVHQLVR